MTFDIRVLSAGDASVLDRVAPDVFDHPIDAQATKDVLADRRHHIVVAMDGDFVVGFVSAVDHLHPDKPQPELWINEIGVSPAFQRKGIATSMMARMLQLGRDMGCREAWLLTNRSNSPATHLFTSTGGVASPDDEIMYAFDLTAAE